MIISKSGQPIKIVKPERQPDNKYLSICTFHVGDLVRVKPGCGYNLYDRGIMSFSRKPISGIIEPARSGTQEPVDCFGTVYISIAAGIKASTSRVEKQCEAGL